MEIEVYLLDLLGTFTFASYGAFLALKHKYDLFGVLLIGAITALGGGAFRELVIGDMPEFFNDLAYSAAVATGVAFTIIARKTYNVSSQLFVALDSLGLVVFAFVGAERAVELNLGLVGIVFAATSTAVGGGIMRDVILNQKPEVMYRGFYASVAFLLGTAYFAMQHISPGLLQANILIFVFLLVRFWALQKNIHLWKPKV